MSGTEALHLHMQRHRDKLIDIIDSEFGLLNIFLENQVLSNREVRRIKSKTSDRKNEILLNIISENDKHEEFIAALKQSSQNHVANWIIADGKFTDEFGLDWPLTDKENEALDMNDSLLVDILDTCDLLNILYSKEVINRWQKEFIESKQTYLDKNEALLEIVRRLSRKGYYIFIKCLRDSNQGYISDSLEYRGELETERRRLFATVMEAKEEDDSDEFWESCEMEETDVQQFRYCVDCGRRLKRTDESKHVKCICGCEFCFVCLKKTKEVGSVKVLRCQLDDTCSAAPLQTERSFNESEGAEGWFGSASSQSSEPKPTPSQSAPLEPRSADTKRLV